MGHFAGALEKSVPSNIREALSRSKQLTQFAQARKLRPAKMREEAA
jgi:hypothetical protein